MGQRLEDGRPEGQNLAKPGFGLRQPYPEGGKPKPDSASVAIKLRDTSADTWGYSGYRCELVN